MILTKERKRELIKTLSEISQEEWDYMESIVNKQKDKDNLNDL